MEFNQLKKANTNHFPTQEPDTTIDNAISDAQQALLLTRNHASQWGINPERIGYVGFSAGGGVVVGATVRATAATMPAFLGTLYGPSLIDVEVPKNAPGLFIGVHADHPNVAAGCMALFMEWKKAGIDAELHVYGKYTGGMFGGNQLKDRNTPNGAWQETFYSWLVANRYVESVAQPVATITSGAIQGSLNDEIVSFKGIPYAQAERFMPPQKVTPWSGVRSCTAYGPWALPNLSPRRLRHPCTSFSSTGNRPLPGVSLALLTVWKFPLCSIRPSWKGI